MLMVPTIAQSEGIPLQKDIFLNTPIFGPEDLPEEITFTLYDSQTATTPIGFQTYQRGQYTVDFEFSKSDGITAGNVARVSADFTKALNLKDAEDEAIQPKEIWAGIEMGGAEIGDRTKVSYETLVQLLLSSDASIATYLTLAYEGDDNPITTIYKDLPISSLSSDGFGSSLNNYFKAVTAGASEGVIEPNSTSSPYWDKLGSNIYFNDGRVGIGTMSPRTLLHVKGSSPSNISRFMQDNASGHGLYVRTQGSGTQFALRVDVNAAAKTPFAVLNNGNVGIGTRSPGTLLHVKGSSPSNISRFMQDNASGHGLYIRTQGSGTQFALRVDVNAAAETPFIVLNNGNVGIGTRSPIYELTVNGTIRAKEIIVDTGWSDFVFEKEYKLPPLNEVEKFIIENKHLPGIPSEAEVKEKGVSVGNISSKLLQKIEELTLYVINLKKENNHLKTQLSTIQTQLNK